MMLSDQLYLAPIGDNPQVRLAPEPAILIPSGLTRAQSILDVGTGTGIWAM